MINAAKFRGESLTSSLNGDSVSATLDQTSTNIKSYKVSFWSSVFASAFSVFDTYNMSLVCEQKASNNKTTGWTTALKERITGSCKTGVSNSSIDIWLLGVCYNVSSEKASHDAVVSSNGLVPSHDAVVSSNGLVQFLHDISSRIWITYRKGFDAIGDSKFTSDVNWGCMLRSSQMLVAQALIFHHLGRSWRKTSEKPYDPKYLEILSFFGDSETSAFSIHNLLEAGKAYGLAAGSWVGPYAMCHSWENLARSKKGQTGHQSFPMAVYIVSGDEDGERGGAPVICVEDVSKVCTEFCKGEVEWTPILLLVPLVLGLDIVNPRYLPSLWATFTFPQSLGIIGGKPGASTYIVGVQDGNAFYLDPHQVQMVADVGNASLEVDTSSYHCSVVGQHPLDMIDPSLAIGFYCRDRDDFDDFCDRASKLAAESNGAPLLTVTESHKPPRVVRDHGSSTGSGGDGAVDHMNELEVSQTEDDWQLL